MILPWLDTKSVPHEVFHKICRRTAFENFKWDLQVEDVRTLADFPIVLKKEVWTKIVAQSVELYRETIQAEDEIIKRPDLIRKLGLGWQLSRAIAMSGRIVSESHNTLRVMRFDYHWTDEGWRISEVNSDVPGGFIESSGFTRIMQEQYPDLRVSGDPTKTLVQKMIQKVRRGGNVAFVYATGYSDDAQVMYYLARECERAGFRVFLGAPDQVCWKDDRAMWQGKNQREEIHALFRFFPAEWLPNLGRMPKWRGYFFATQTLCSNPATALISQSKRFPLVWDELTTKMTLWRELLPATFKVYPKALRQNHHYVLKPVLGRIGEGIGMESVTIPRMLRKYKWQSLLHPSEWVLQKKFNAIPLQLDGELYFPCIGVYVIDGDVAGAYGRVARKPLIDAHSQEAAVLLSQ